jgi:ADP-ribose pyrophosphatase YjhB (NUDIX family)
MKEKIEFEFSAGGILMDKGKVLVINLVNPDEKQVWTLPKGKIEKGESPETAAKRELLEETGYCAQVMSQMAATGYIFSRNNSMVIKKVYWFLMISPEKIASAETGILVVDWMSVKDALKILDYRLDVMIVKSLSQEKVQ